MSKLILGSLLSHIWFYVSFLVANTHWAPTINPKAETRSLSIFYLLSLWYTNERVLGSLSVCEHLPAVSRITCPNLIWSLHKCTLSTPGWRLHHCLNHRFVQKEFSRRFLLMDYRLNGNHNRLKEC